MLWETIMTAKEVKQLQTGDEVKWNDPDECICPRYIVIQNIEVKGEIVCLTGTDGYYTECFANELS